MSTFDELAPEVAAIEKKLDQHDAADTLRNGAYEAEKRDLQAQMSVQEAQTAAIQKKYDDHMATHLPPAPVERTVYELNIANQPLGACTDAVLDSIFGSSPPLSWWAPYKPAIVSGRNGRKAFEFTLPANSLAGPVFFVPFEAVKEMTYTSEIEMCSPADIPYGGKLNGVGATVTTANPPTGGAEPVSGLTIREMLLGPGMGAGTVTGQLLIYPYRQSKPGETNPQFGFNEMMVGKTMKLDAIQKTTIHAKMNTFKTDGTPNLDGVLQGKVDSDVWNFDQTNYFWHTDKTMPIANRYALSCFRGGSTDAWKSTKVTKYRFYSGKVTTLEPAKVSMLRTLYSAPVGYSLEENSVHNHPNSRV